MSVNVTHKAAPAAYGGIGLAAPKRAARHQVSQNTACLTASINRRRNTGVAHLADKLTGTQAVQLM